ncbi:Crp/Fnr family transcriptional regulator [Streptomyces sp. NPDC050264]|uniref:Crp/Fnr family transcriptional regulator n=1 Tax=Streptomyces sp. NPDC050264 TaxID=3155038 RepID=UPI0034189640
MNFRDMVPAGTWQELIERGRQMYYRRGAVLLRQGDHSESVIALSEGTVKVTQVTEAGAALTLTLRGPGEVLGEMGVILDRPRSATLVAVSPCTGSVIAAGVFLECLNQLDLVPAVYRLAVDRMQHTEQLRMDLISLPPAARIARVVLHLALEVGRPASDGMRVDLGMPREELAAMAAVGRSSAVPLLRRLHEEGVLELNRARLTVRDLPRLEEAACSTGPSEREM